MGRAAIHVVFPVTDEVLLVEEGEVRAEETVHPSTMLAVVEHLTTCFLVSVDTWRVLGKEKEQWGGGSGKIGKSKT